jgi:putative sigma-54 modulation protein
VTIFVHPSILRAEECGATVEEAVDSVERKLVHQIERYKQKHHRRTPTGEWIQESTLEQLSTAQTEAPLRVSPILKRKRIGELEKIHEEEAIEQLELIDHDFYIFDSKDTGFISVVYRRRDGTYGIIEVEKWTLKKW